MKRLIGGAIAVLAIAVLYARVQPTRTPWRISHYENVLGTSMELRLVAVSDDAEDKAAAAAMDEIKRLNSILSGYDRSSEFSRWAATKGQAVPVSPDLMEVLQLWDSWRGRTGGALNPAAEAVSLVWKNAESAGRLPTEREMADAAELANGRQWRIDASIRNGAAADRFASEIELFHKELHHREGGRRRAANARRDRRGGRTSGAIWW